MRWILIILAIPVTVFAWDFTQERNTIPVYFDSAACQVPWTTGYNCINPTFCDIDGDGDYDLIFGSDWNRASLYENTGDSIRMSYSFVSDSFVHFTHPPPMWQRQFKPTFCDIDADGDEDLLFGAYDRLFFYRNIGNRQNPVYIMVYEYFQRINHRTSHLPSFVDIDDDNDYDLFIGFGSSLSALSGKIAFYLNEGIPDSVSLVLVTDYFMNIDLGYYCFPTFTDIDADGDYDMFLGDEGGHIYYYRNDGTAQQYDFTFVTSQYQGVDVREKASPAFCDVDADGDYDLFVGSKSSRGDWYYGDIYFYRNTGRPDSAVFTLITKNFLSIDMGTDAAPNFADIDADGQIDLFISECDGAIHYFHNEGLPRSPVFHLTEPCFQGINGYFHCRFDFGDLDNDGDLDLVTGGGSMRRGRIDIYVNSGTPAEPVFELYRPWAMGIRHREPGPKLVDIDNDGDLDLFIPHVWNQTAFWENRGSPEQPIFHLVTLEYFGMPYEGNFCSVCFGDLDRDGDYDALRFDAPHLQFYRNVGSASSPDFVLEDSSFLDLTLWLGSDPYLVDVDNDRDLDLFVGDAFGGVSFWRNLEITDLMVILTPGAPVINIAQSGGVFDFTIRAVNTSLSPMDFDAWTELVLPTGRLITPILLRSGFNLYPGATISRHITQTVPGSAPGGSYWYVGKVGVYPDSVADSDKFPFVKLP